LFCGIFGTTEVVPYYKAFLKLALEMQVEIIEETMTTTGAKPPGATDEASAATASRSSRSSSRKTSPIDGGPVRDLDDGGDFRRRAGDEA